MAAPRKVKIESQEFGDFEGPDFPSAIKKAVDAFGPYVDHDEFLIDLVSVDGYYLHENSVENIQMEIEDAVVQWRKEAEQEYKGRTEWTHPDTGGRF